VTQRGLVSDASGQTIRPMGPARRLKLGPIGRPKTSVTVNLCYVTALKGEGT
jgi:hypothetical protein